MMTTSYTCGSCALGSISDLGTHRDPVNALKAFIRLELGGSARWTNPYYVFVAGPEVEGKGHSKNWVRYGTEFAQYLTDNKLGPVQTLGPIINHKYHPDTTCQVWIWQPDAFALKEWAKVQALAPKPRFFATRAQKEVLSPTAAVEPTAKPKRVRKPKAEGEVKARKPRKVAA